MKYVVPEEARTSIGNVRYLDDLRQLARNNRNDPTKGELLMWSLLRNDRLGVHFLRQKPIGRFIIDFYSSKILLAIEVDGDSHDGRLNYDDGRDKYLMVRRVLTVRFRNDDVLKHLLGVEAEIKEIVLERVSLFQREKP